jgi:hypothetical protein
MFYHGGHSYVPASLAVSYSLNAPSLVVSGLVHGFLVRQFDYTERWFHYGQIEYYIFLFIFWWSIGWKMDRKPKLEPPRSLTAVAAYSLGLLFAVVLICCGTILPGNAYGTRAVPMSMLLWGLALLLYFGRKLASIVRGGTHPAGGADL